MLSERGCVDQADAFADRLCFFYGIVPPCTAPERATVMIKIIGGIKRAIIIRTFPAIDLTKLRTKCLLAIIGRCRAQWATGFALFIWMMQNIDVVVAFFVLARRIFGRHPAAVTLRIKARHINLGLAFDHHLGHIIAHTTRGSNAEAEAFGQPHIAQTRRWTHQRIAIWRIANRAVEIILQTAFFARWHAVDHRHILLFDTL